MEKSRIEEISKKIPTGLSVLKRISPAIPGLKLDKPCIKLLFCPILTTPAVCGDI